MGRKGRASKGRGFKKSAFKNISRKDSNAIIFVEAVNVTFAPKTASSSTFTRIRFVN